MAKFEDIYKAIEKTNEIPDNFYTINGEKKRNDYISEKLTELWYNLNKNDRKLKMKKQAFIKSRNNFQITKKALKKKNKNIKNDIGVLNEYKK